MAREGQGLQILVIVFVFLTMLLAFGTWYGISNYATTAEVLANTKAELDAEKKLRNDYNTEADALRYMVNFPPFKEEQFKQAAAQLTGGGTDSTVQTRFQEVLEHLIRIWTKSPGVPKVLPTGEHSRQN